jgi:hypothetical protein
LQKSFIRKCQTWLLSGIIAFRHDCFQAWLLSGINMMRTMTCEKSFIRKCQTWLISGIKMMWTMTCKKSFIRKCQARLFKHKHGADNNLQKKVFF